MRTTSIAALSGALLIACSSPARPPAAMAAEGSPAATPKPPPEVVKPVAPPTTAPVFELSAVSWKPQVPATLGKREITAIPCKLERGRGPEPIDKMSIRTSRVVMQGGKLYLLDTAGKLRRYDNASPDACELRLDPTFGNAGILDSGEVGEETIDDMAVDQSGTIYLSGWRTKTLRRLIDGKIEDVCPISMKSLHADPSSPLLVMNEQPVTIAHGQCQTHPVRYAGLPEHRAIFALPFGADLIAVRNDDGEFSVSLHLVDGKLKTRMVRKGENGRLFHVQRASSCAVGVCVLDLNGRQITAWTIAGAYVGVINLLPLLGLDNPWPKDIAIGDTESFLVVHQRGSGDDNNTVLFRVLGLR